MSKKNIRTNQTMSYFGQPSTYDDYITPASTWELIRNYIPRDKILLDPFYCNGQCALVSLGYHVIHNNADFFTSPPPPCDVIVTNPPFSKTKEVLQHLKTLEKPFILILPLQKVTTRYFKETYGNDPHLQLIIPVKRMHFGRYDRTTNTVSYPNKTNFDSIFYCYKMHLPQQVTWI